MVAIALSTFKEVYRKRIVHVIGILTLLYLGILSFIVHEMNESMSQQQQLIDAFMSFSSTMSILGFYFSTMLVAFLTVMLSISIVSSEIESGTILTILTKPISRAEYIIGKYLGTAALVFLYSLFLYIAVVIICSTGNVPMIKTVGIAKLSKGFIFFILEPLTILSLALWGSTKFKTLNNGIFVIAIYILGTIGAVMEQIGAITEKEALSTIGIISSLISPFEIIYKKMISTVFSSLGRFNFFNGFGMEGKSTTPSTWMMIYVCAYLLFFIFISIRGFQKKDIG